MCYPIAQCPILVNGALHCPNGATTGVFEDTCTFSCNAGYKLQGSNNGTCLANQSWSGGDPNCVPICPTPLNGQVACSEGNNCTFSCDPGYMLQGSVTTGTCENNGSWSGGLPSCVPLNCSEDNLSVPANARAPRAPSCDLTYQSQCTVSCDEGFTGDDITYLCNVTSDPTMVDWVPSGGVVVMCERGLFKYV